MQALDAVTDQCLSISGAREEVTTTNLKGQNLKNKFHDYDLRKVVTELKASDETKKMVTVIDRKYKG